MRVNVVSGSSRRIARGGHAERPNTSTGPGPSPMSRRPPRPQRRRSGAPVGRPAPAPRRWRGTRPALRSGCSQSRARRRRGGGRRGSRPPSSPSKKRSTDPSLWPPVTTTAAGPSATTARASSSWDALLPQPGQLPRLGNVRGHHGAQRQQTLDQRPAAPPRRAAPHRSRRPSPDRSPPAPPPTMPKSRDHCLDGLGRSQHPDLHRIDSDVLGDRPHLRHDHLRQRPPRPPRPRPCSAP